MPYKSLWLFLRFFTKLKIQFIARKSLFFEPPSTGNLRKKRMHNGNLRRNFMSTKYVQEKGLGVYVEIS